MMLPDWKIQLRREASARHMCEENRTALEKVESKAEAISLYKKTIDWALEEGYPRMDTLRRFFSDCADEGIFVDREFHGETLKDHQVYVFHNCKGHIRTGLNVEKQIVPMMYFANECDMRISSSDSLGIATRVPLYVFGANRISAEHSEDIVCKIYNFETK